MIDLRAATPDDAAAITAIYAPYVVTNAVAFESSAPSVDAMRVRIAETIDLYPWIAAIDKESDVLLGYTYAKPFRAGGCYRFTVETAVYGMGDIEGQGIRRTLYTSLMATLTKQNFTQAIATLTMPNDKLIQLHEALGFRRAGVYREVCHKNNMWIDVGHYQRGLAEGGKEPDDVARFGDVGVVRS